MVNTARLAYLGRVKELDAGPPSGTLKALAWSLDDRRRETGMIRSAGVSLGVAL